MNLLSIDYGTKKTGLAINVGSIAIPLKIIPTSTAISEIQKIVEERKIEALILGIANNLDGKESTISNKIKSFAGQLKKNIPENIKIIFHDESYTSFEAKNNLIEIGIKGEDIKKFDDIAACLILQSYLDGGNA